jgi:hypothetical protein
MFKLRVEEREPVKPDVDLHQTYFSEADFVSALNDRLDKHKNVIMIVHGETGEGKSYLAMALAEKMDKNFSVKNVIFWDNLDEFVDLVKGLPPRSWIVVDDAGALLDAREFMTAINKMMSYVLEMFRFKQICIIFTTPNRMMLDKNARRVSHYLVFQKGWGYAAVYRQKMNYRGDIYPLFLFHFDGVKKPSEKLCKEYEKKKATAFSKMLETYKGTPSQEKEDEEIEEFPDIPAIPSPNVTDSSDLDNMGIESLLEENKKEEKNEHKEEDV